MFSNEERMIYAKRQLVEVICQLRFPEILSIEERVKAHRKNQNGYDSQ